MVMLFNLAAVAMASTADVQNVDTTSCSHPSSSSMSATTAANTSSPPVLAKPPGLEDLNMLLPAFLAASPWLTFVLRALHIDPRALLPIVGFLSFMTFAWQSLERHVFNQLAFFMSTVEIKGNDEVYDVVKSWIAKQNFGRHSRHFVVNSGAFSLRERYYDPYDSDDDDDMYDLGGEGGKGKNLLFTPSEGSHYFWYRRRLLVFRRSGSKNSDNIMANQNREDMSISCFGRSPHVLKLLLEEAYEEYSHRDDDKTLIYRGIRHNQWSEASWQRCLVRASRPFSTVVMNDKAKQSIVNDLEDYIEPATRKWYFNRGIPYRRGYLFHGPPGTGKSSLSLALAGHFKMKIYMVSLSSKFADEENLSSLFAVLPRRCIVLLEDIDTAGLAHTRDQPSSDSEVDMEDGDAVNISSPKKDHKGRLSLSGLLNILDGVASQEGRILIMTTNHIDQLDQALLRPGRVDMKVKFDRADREITSAIFCSIFGRFEDEEDSCSSAGSRVRDDTSEDESSKAAKKREGEKRARHEAEIKRVKDLGSRFAANVPEREFSPAELQGFLLKHKRHPERAIAGVAEWAKDMLVERVENEKREAEEKRKKQEKKALKNEKRRALDKKRLKEAKARKAKEEEENEKGSGGDSGSESDSEGGGNQKSNSGGKQKESMKTKREKKGEAREGSSEMKEKGSSERKSGAKKKAEEEDVAKDESEMTDSGNVDASVFPVPDASKVEAVNELNGTQGLLGVEAPVKHAGDSGYETP